MDVRRDSSVCLTRQRLQERSLVGQAERTRCSRISCVFVTWQQLINPAAALLLHRQELFPYRPTFDRTQYASQVNRKRQTPLSLYEDPEFWSLEAPHRRRVELMQPEERVHYGFGPYPADAPHEATLEDELRSFQCSKSCIPTGLLFGARLT